MKRQQQRRQKRQRMKVAKIVENFLVLYNKEVNKVRNKYKKVEDLKHYLTEVNVIYLQVWRGVLAAVKKDYPLALLDPNHFEPFMVWGDEINITEAQVIE